MIICFYPECLHYIPYEREGYQNDQCDHCGELEDDIIEKHDRRKGDLCSNNGFLGRAYWIEYH